MLILGFLTLSLLPCFATAVAVSLNAAPVLRALRKPPGAVAVVVRLSPSAVSSEAELRDVSERLRAAGASAIVLRGEASALRVVLDEQRSAASEFPGPCPVLYQPVPAPASSRALHGCGAQGLVLPYSVLASDREGAAGASEALPLVLTAQTAAELRTAAAAAAAGDGAAWPLVLATASAWQGLIDEAAAPPTDGPGAQGSALEAGGAAAPARVVLASGALVLAVLDLETGDAGVRAREWRAAGCAGVVVDYDPAEWPGGPEPLLRELLSKKSSSFGGLAMHQGVSLGASGISDQFWLNKNMKEAKAIGAKRARETGGAGAA